MAKNIQLKLSVEKLSVLVFKKYYSRINKEGLEIGDFYRISCFRALEKYGSEITELLEFKNCEDILNNDTKITVFGNLVGTEMARESIGSPKECIISFLYQLYFKNNTWNNLSFEELYDSFESLFYDEIVRMVDTCLIYNVSCQNTVMFDDNVKMEVFSEDDLEKTKQFPTKWGSFGNYCLLKREYEVEKVVKKLTQNEREEKIPIIKNYQIFDSRPYFEAIVKSIRLLKHSSVVLDNTIVRKIVTFFPHTGEVHSTRDGIISSLKRWVEINNEDEANLKRYYAHLINSEKEPLKNIAINRLSSGMEKFTDEDKILDYMIGLEALYLPDGNHELSFRLSLRISFLMRKCSEEREELFSFMKKMYDIRSKMVHGNKYKLLKEDVERVEATLRESIHLCIENKELFEEYSLNKMLFEQIDTVKSIDMESE